MLLVSIIFGLFDKSRYYIYQLENKIDRKSKQNNSRCFSVILVSIIFISIEILNNYCNSNSKVLPRLFILPGELLSKIQLLFKTFSLNFCNEVEIVFPTPIVGMRTDFSGVLFKICFTKCLKITFQHQYQ